MSSVYVFVQSGPDAGACFEVGDEEGGRIGRDAECEVRLGEDHLVSKLHAEIFFDHMVGRFAVRDLGSTNGLLVNGSVVSGEQVVVKVGDEIKLGRTNLVLLDSPPAPGDDDEGLVLRAFAELGRLAVEADPIDSLEALARQLRRAARCNGAVIAIYHGGEGKPTLEVHDDDREVPVEAPTSRWSREAILGTRRVAEEAPLRSLMALVAEKQRPLSIADVRTRADVGRDRPADKYGVRACVLHPLVIDGALLGVAHVYRTTPGELDLPSRTAAAVGASFITLALARVRGE